MPLLPPLKSNCIKVAQGFDAAANGGDTNIPFGLFDLLPGQSLDYWVVREKRHPTNPVALTGPVNIKAGTNAPDYNNIIQGVSNSVGNQLYQNGWARFANDGEDPVTVYVFIESQSIEGSIVVSFMVDLNQA